MLLKFLLILNIVNEENWLMQSIKMLTGYNISLITINFIKPALVTSQLLKHKDKLTSCSTGHYQQNFNKSDCRGSYKPRISPYGYH